AISHLSPVKEEITKNVDILIVRELASGIYFGDKQKKVIEGEKVYSDLELYKESEIRRIAKKAFEYAVKRSNKVSLVAKSNVLVSSELWREVVVEVSEEFPSVELDYLHVDNAAMQIILNPKQFDVILTSNMFGDILSDEASILLGSIGLAPSASLGYDNFGLYEPIHGSAPSIAGKNIANPLSSILCLPLMLKYSFGLYQEAECILNAVDEVLKDGYRTIDLKAINDDTKKIISTTEMGDIVSLYISNK
ncbi:MAG: 3-isopropylmalate dehydrogenase, partial [Gorillibacterium sp.]|nr:3-isopropylmalate dehydrogenase [Gorillibacterium sp.]